MNPVRVVRVRWQKGVERIDVTPNDTIGSIVDKMAAKYDFDGSRLGLLQESTKTITARRARLCQLEIENGEMFQSTMYSGHSYGSVKGDIEKILATGKHVLTTMDICGAMSLKTHFKNVTTIYIRRQKKAIIANLLRKNSSIEDKANRIMAIDFAEKTADLCDYVVQFDLYDEATEKLSKLLQLEK